MKDDVISAMRYCAMSLRKARVKNYEPTYIQAESEFNVFAQEIKMPSGKGTYGTKKGRPPKRKPK